MNNSTARKIAALVNRRNNLPSKLKDFDIINNNYFYVEVKDDDKKEVVACARAKCMSFFAYEIKHVAVDEKYEGNGFGRTVIELVEDYLRIKQIPIAMATTRADNAPIIHLFTKLGYSRSNEFVNSGTKHPLILWQKQLL